MKPIGVICALPRELGRLYRRPPRDWMVIAGGVGADAAERAARRLPDARLLVSAGYAGGLAAPAERGVIVIDTANRKLDAALEKADEHALAVTVRGRIADSQTIISTPEARARLAADTGAIAVDMESAAVARVARERGIPFVAIRVITDGPGDALLIDWDRYRRPDGSMRTAAAVFSALRRPRGMAELLRLWYSSNEATRVLSDYLWSFLDVC